MNFLLVAINAKYIHSNPAVFSLKAFVDKSFPNSVNIAEYTINNKTDDILEDIYRHKPDAIGFSVYIWNIETVKELVTELSKILPDTDIWLGGPEVSYDYKNTFEAMPLIKGVFIGEGEKPFEEVIARYIESGDNDFSDIQGVVLSERDTVSMLDVVNMNELPFFYYDGLDKFDNRIIYYESARGCPYRCSYCLSSIEKTTRFRELELVKKEIKFFLEQKVKQVKFIDRTFNCNSDRATELWNYIYQNDNGITNFHFEIAADILDDKQINILQKLRPGLVQLEIGVQSVNLRTLKEVNRVTDIAVIEKNVKALNQNHNIHVHLDLIAGLPYENYESFVNSFNTVYRMRPCQLQLGFLKVLKGTVISEKADEYEIKYTGKPPYEVLSTKWISYEEIRKLKAVAEMVEFYYNSAQFINGIALLEKEFESPYELYSSLSEFYKRKGYFVRTPARSRKYEVLLEFASENTDCNDKKLREALTLDYYMRENPKNKPDFAVQLPDNIKLDYTRKDPLTGNCLQIFN